MVDEDGNPKIGFPCFEVPGGRIGWFDNESEAMRSGSACGVNPLEDGFDSGGGEILENL